MSTRTHYPQFSAQFTNAAAADNFPHTLFFPFLTWSVPLNNFLGASSLVLIPVYTHPAPATLSTSNQH